MADPREFFAVLKDSNNEGQALDQAAEGLSPSGLKGLIGFAFKDASGNLVLPQLVDGKLPVTSEGAGTPKASRAEVALGSLTEVDIATITLTADKTYSEIEFIVSCRRSAYYKLVQIDDATTTVLADVLLDAGQYTFQGYAPKREIIAGSTGTQVLKIVGKNLDKESALRASLSCVEMVGA